MTKTVLITGVAGFVGTNLSRYLISKNYKVIGIDISDRHGRLERSNLINDKNFSFWSLNLAIENIPNENKLKNISAIFHLAALPHVDFSYFYPNQTIMNNIKSLLNTIELACKLHKPLILSSSVEVYGGLKDKKYTEKNLSSALSAYAASKIACEAIINAYVETQGLIATVFRFTNLYGPWQAPDRLIPRVISQILLDKDVVIEIGTNRDYVFIEDVCNILESAIYFEHKGEIFNLSSGIKIDNFGVAKMITNQLPSKKITVIESKIKDGRGKYLISDPKKLQKKMGRGLNTSLEEGITITTNWYIANKDWLFRFKHNLSADRNSNQFLTDSLDLL